jgi:hypothetical protein
MSNAVNRPPLPLTLETAIAKVDEWHDDSSAWYRSYNNE